MGNGARPNIVSMTAESGGESHEDSSGSGSTTTTGTATKKTKTNVKKGVDPKGGKGQKAGQSQPLQQKNQRRDP